MIESLHETASKITGLDDFGDQDYLEGMQVLIDAYTNQAQLTERGWKIKRSFLRGALMARLFSQSAWNQNPSYQDIAIQRPIFVTGLPRTGTTALHRLLTVDPAHQGLQAWLTDVPQPRPPRSTWADNPIFGAIQAGYERHHQENPTLAGMHYTAADQVEECWQLLRQSMMAQSFECLAYIPAYSQWLSEQDWTPAYQRHKRNLQMIGLNDADKRWVLKYPSHMFALDALLAVYPDALIVQTHRSPQTVIASICSLNAHASAGWSTYYEGPALGRAQLDLWSRAQSTFDTARAKHDSAHFIDVQYEDLVGNPIGTVKAIYERVGASLSSETIAAMQETNTEGQSRSAHRYDLADFALTPADVDHAFPPR